MEINNLITTGRSDYNKAAVKLYQCGLGQFRRTDISLTAINVTAEARTMSQFSLCEIIVKTAGEGQAILSNSC